MALPNGKYRTRAGSTVEISGVHRLTWTCDHCGGGDALLYKDGMGFTAKSLAVDTAGGFTSFLAYAEQRRTASAMFAVAAIAAGSFYPDELLTMINALWILAIIAGGCMFAFYSRTRVPALLMLRLFLFMEVLSVTRRIVG